MNKGFNLFLEQLTIQNLGIIDQQTIDFHPQFNAIIGETGSGKSLVLDAIELIIGFRGDKKLIRKGSDFLVVEGVFKTKDPAIKSFFGEAGFPFSEEISIKRIIYATGNSKTYVNQQISTLQFLKIFSRKYIDVVGQFENQKLLSAEYQLRLLDLFAGNYTILENYKKIFHTIREQRLILANLLEKQDELIKKQDYIEFQVNQFEALSPSIHDELELIKTKDQLKKKLECRESLDEMNFIFEGDSARVGLLGLLHKLEKNFTSNIFSESDQNNFFQAKELLNDLNYKVNHEQNSDFPEAEYEEIVDRLNEYQKLKRKFNTDTQGLETAYQELTEQLLKIKSIEKEIQEVEEDIKKKMNSAQAIALKLHTARDKAAKSLSKDLTKMIQSLRMEKAEIRVEANQITELSSNGLTEVRFMAETNTGEGFYEIRDIASGGELSRILLAIRNILAAKDSISIFLFDEIDTGIGGETALCVGSAIENVAASSQVITITHLPQIAKFADRVLKVEKGTTRADQRTVASVVLLEGEMKNVEVQAMVPLN